MMASSKGHLDIVKYLVNIGVELEAINNVSLTIISMYFILTASASGQSSY